LISAGDHRRHPPVAPLPNLGEQRDFPQKRDLLPLRLGLPAAVAKDFHPLPAGGGEVAHVFHNAKDGHIDLLEHPDPLAHHAQRRLLRGGHNHAPVQRHGLADRKLRIPGARRQIHHQHIQVAPFHFAEELLNGLVDHRPAPDHRLVALQPVDTIAQTARQITAADDLSRRIPYDGPPDELGQLTQTFNETLARLERLFNVQRRFVADVSHEMRTPLTTIRGNVDLMRRFGYDEEAIAAIDGEARRMSRLVEDLLLLAKADAGRLPLERQLVELDSIVVEVFNQARVLSDTVTVALGPVEPARVIGDSDRIKQLLLNLISNGLKYTPEGGTVTLGLQRDGEWVDVNVTDTGVGIPAEDLPHIFDRFYRVDKARSRAQGGTGLGLSIAKWLAEAHGGQITVTSEPGSGSTFTIRLPLVADQAHQASIRDTIPNLRPVRLPRPR